MNGEKINVIAITPTSVTLEVENDFPYYLMSTKKEWDVYLNHTFVKKIQSNVFSIFDLSPDTTYLVEVKDQNQELIMNIKTCEVKYFLDVRKFGAKGDGIHNDTLAIQTAIMACPTDGLIIVPPGEYLVTTLFLKSDTKIELKKGALIKASTNREHFPILPSVLSSNDGTPENEYFLGSWEGDPFDNFASVITGINVQNVLLYGEGTVDGCAHLSDWWINHKVVRIAYRPHLLFLKGCDKVQVLGLTFQNSPSWTLHPFYSSNLSFLDLKIENPKESPNTDGLNPESCRNVEIVGVVFNVGDDCIALKSGKIYMARNHYQPCENVTIRNCLMKYGHGAVVIGSEMSCGMKNIQVEKCYFLETDRGIRIKTRRGRGNKARIDQLEVSNIIMDGVLTPLVMNMFYFCDPDGKTEYVYSKEALPVTDLTPSLGKFKFQNIICTNVAISAGFFYGLKEAPIESISLENVSFRYQDNPSPGYPAMMSFIEKRSKEGLYFHNVQEVILKDVTIEGQDGLPIVTNNVQNFVQMKKGEKNA